MKVFVPGLLVFALFACVDAALQRCVKAFQFEGYVYDKRSLLPSVCPSHSGRTCCQQSHVLQIANRVATMQHSKFSERCIQESQEALCAICDGDVGNGKLLKAGRILVCPDVCRRWFEACQFDFFSGTIDGLMPCALDALSCSPLHLIVESAPQFCRKVFSIFDVDQLPEALDLTNRFEGCFDGVSAASRDGVAAPPPVPTTPGSSWSEKWLRGLKIVTARLHAFFHRNLGEGYQALLIAFTVIVIFIGTKLVPKSHRVEDEDDAEESDIQYYATKKTPTGNACSSIEVPSETMPSAFECGEIGGLSHEQLGFTVRSDVPESKLDRFKITRD